MHRPEQHPAAEPEHQPGREPCAGGPARLRGGASRAGGPLPACAWPRARDAPNTSPGRQPERQPKHPPGRQPGHQAEHQPGSSPATMTDGAGASSRECATRPAPGWRPGSSGWRDSSASGWPPGGHTWVGFTGAWRVGGGQHLVEQEVFDAVAGPPVARGIRGQTVAVSSVLRKVSRTRVRVAGLLSAVARGPSGRRGAVEPALAARSAATVSWTPARKPASSAVPIDRLESTPWRPPGRLAGPRGHLLGAGEEYDAEYCLLTERLQCRRPQLGLDRSNPSRITATLPRSPAP